MSDLDKLITLIGEVRERGLTLGSIVLNPFEYVSVWSAAHGFIVTSTLTERDDPPVGPLKVCGVEIDCIRDAASLDQCREANKNGEWPPQFSKFYVGVPKAQFMRQVKR